ncbi:4-hydroxy-tetrahydrodipicolinate synthase [Leptonema illini]|uniref:4-hydroxy-tetrahydrodipicolinate synthase n=1 Tax=Leptonema illini DSM 21528 TaxID=929563 RepID=H2CHR7_9LEPT|nr:4-hydroxy-tetrahydrodipicolinate synthase [Leptonema illini]EHQ05912.1 dihydrodipicolinate synthase [Leptonema illini DSM 21528]
MKLEGLYTALITPFTADGSKIDYEAFAKLIERQIAGGVSGVVPCGTTGESPTLSHEEHAELIAQTVKLVNGRVQVIAGTGSNSTTEAIELTEQACKAGVDAVMLVNPYYNKPSQEGLYRHFKAVAERSSKPVVLYNIRGRTAVNVEPETFVRLAEIPNIVSVKEASGDLNQMARIIGLTKGRLALLSGDDNLTPAVIGVGGKGVISVASNLYPKKLSRMVGKYLSGDFTGGNVIFYEMLEFMNALFWETNPVPVKTGAAMLGHCTPAMRLPLVEMPADKAAKFKALLDQIGADA